MIIPSSTKPETRDEKILRQAEEIRPKPGIYNSLMLGFSVLSNSTGEEALNRVINSFKRLKY